MTQQPTIRKKGKRSGRPIKLDPDIEERIADDEMREQLERQMNGPEGPRTLDIIRLEGSKRAGPLKKQQVLRLIEQEAARRGETGGPIPTVDNFAAVERWMRDPGASSYEAAMSPRGKGKGGKKKL